MPVAEERELLTLKEAEEQYRVSLNTLRYWIARGELTKYKRGGKVNMVDAEEVRKKVADREKIERLD